MLICHLGFFFSIKLYLLVHKMTLIHRGQGETEERGSHSRVVGGRFNKQGNLHMRLILGCHKTRRSPHPPAKILKVDIETLPGFSCVYRADGLSSPHPWKRLPLWEHHTCFTRPGEEMRRLQLPGSSFRFNWRSCPLRDLLQHYTLKIQLHCCSCI